MLSVGLTFFLFAPCILLISNMVMMLPIPKKKKKVLEHESIALSAALGIMSRAALVEL